MTTTVVDQLVVTLELDPRKFDASIEKVKATLKSLETATKGMQVRLGNNLAQGLTKAGDAGQKAGQKIENGMRGGRMGVMMLIGAAYKLNEALGLPAMYKHTKEVVDSETKLLRLAESLRLNTTELQAWQKTVQIHGGDADKFNTSIEKISENLGKMGTGFSMGGTGLAGVTYAMIRGRDALGVMKLYAAQMGRMSPGRQMLIGKKIGMDESTIRTLQESGPLLLMQLERMRELAATNEELQNARNVAKAQEEANVQWERAKQILAAGFMPALQRLSHALSWVSKFLREHATVAKVAVTVLIVAMTAFAAYAVGASLMILKAGIVWAQGMNLITGGTWSIGVLAGAAAITALTGTVLALSVASNETRQSHEEMVHQLLHGTDDITRANRAMKEYNETVDLLKKNIEALTKELAAVNYGEAEGITFEMAETPEQEAKKRAAEAKLQVLQDRLKAYTAGGGFAESLFSKIPPRLSSAQAPTVSAHTPGAPTVTNEINVGPITITVGEGADMEKAAADFVSATRRGMNDKRFVYQPSGGMR